MYAAQTIHCKHFIKNLFQETVVKLLEKICDHMPEHYKEQCTDILENYGKQIIDFLLTSATPHAICMFLHLCLVQDTPALGNYPKCWRNIIILGVSWLRKRKCYFHFRVFSFSLFKASRENINVIFSSNPFSVWMLFSQTHFTTWYEMDKYLGISQKQGSNKI